MKDQLEIRTKDVQRLKAVVDRTHFIDPDDGIPVGVLQAIYDLVACDEVCHLAVDPLHQKFVFDRDLIPYSDVGLETDRAHRDELYWRNFASSMSCSFQYWTGIHNEVHRATDWYESERAYFDSDLGEMMRLTGGRYSSLMPLPSEGLVEHQVVLFRDTGRDFSEREQLLLNLLRPHLAELHLEQRRRRLSGGLTPRQVQLLHLVAQGMTNRQIASRLDLSEGTIRTHMENIFERLGVTSRTAAVARLTQLDGTSR